MQKTHEYHVLRMSRSAMATAPAVIALTAVLFGCGGDSSDGNVANESPVFSDGAEDPGEDPGERDDAPTTPPPPDDVDNGDPFLRQLDHVWVDETGPGYEIVGYDTSDNEIGRVSVHSLGPDELRITQRYYSRSCVDPAIPDDCADIVVVTVNFASLDEPWQEVYLTISGVVALQRLQAMEIMAREQPQARGEGVACALTIAGSAAACGLGVASGSPVLGAGVCGAAVHRAVCGCKHYAKKALPDFDFDGVCP
jgi:hypothetical protein